MAIQSFQLDPAAGGVSQATFDIHTHSYRKLTRIGADDRDQFDSPGWSDVVDDTDTVVTQSVDIEAVAVTVATDSTGTPE